MRGNPEPNEVIQSLNIWFGHTVRLLRDGHILGFRIVIPENHSLHIPRVRGEFHVSPVPR